VEYPGAQRKNTDSFKNVSGFRGTEIFKIISVFREAES